MSYHQVMDKWIGKEKKEIIKISVRNLVEFLLREGDIDNRRGRAASPEAMQAGSRIHRKIQKSMGSGYQAEVPLKITLEQEAYLLTVEGRADGILTEGGPQRKVTIDEIKGVYLRVDLLEDALKVHKAQAMCYAYIYALQQGLAQITVRMTYCNLDTEEMRYFHYGFSFAELSQWFDRLIGEYKKWADFQHKWRDFRQASIHKLEFPYAYRKGQRELAAGVYRTIFRRKTLFIQAPTGAGKTISTVFPAVKAVGEGLGDKIFYLTAKTITGTVAREAFELLRRQGYQAKILTITAKEKLCKCEEMDCNPEHCPYARGHYDRINDAVFQLLQREDVITREILLEQAERHRVCPFELCLDTASWADDIICDYNYVFDPNVCLKRFFAEGIRGDYIFLVDEAHNLVERGREMYSAALYKEELSEIRKLLKNHMPRKAERAFARCGKLLLQYKRDCETRRIYDHVGGLASALTQLASELEGFLQEMPEFPQQKKVAECYLNVRKFLSVYDLVDDRYVIYTEHETGGRFKIKLFCADPSKNLRERMDKGNAAILFSATLLPISYYRNLLSARADDYAIYAETAFSDENRLILLGSDVSSRYARRGQAEYERIASYIKKTAEAKRGNYMVFFPSYRMMEDVYERFRILCGGAANGGAEDAPAVPIHSICQQSGMREEEREAFLREFSGARSGERGGSLVAFCVLGGIFGEGIDLKKEQLIGAIIVGTGLPQISHEREILMDYYEKRSGEGFDYAYRYPGMNKVLQAAGRVIRTAEDVGIIELLDERFLQSGYRNLFPREWENCSVCRVETVSGLLEGFWSGREAETELPLGRDGGQQI